MGKPYRDELRKLGQTTRECYGFDLSRLHRAVEDSAAHGLVIVASGGSHTAANYLAELHQRLVGHPCRVVTPLVFQGAPAHWRGHVWLLSAGGKNGDVLAAATHAIDSGASSITALIASKNSPLQELLSTYGAGRTATFSLSAGGDGFLATNSLWATCLLLDRAYQAAFADLERVTEQDGHSVLAWADSRAKAVSPKIGTDLVGIGDPETMLGLLDMEMRATEAALARVWVSDLRNVGHGRHYWFAAHGRNTQALCLFTPPFAKLAAETIQLVQQASPGDLIEVPWRGRLAQLASIAFSMYLAAELGEHAGRDPGRPGVPPFGESLYNLRFEQPKAADLVHTRDKSLIAAKLGRTVGEVNEAELSLWKPHLDAFRARLASSDIRAVVFDFDGTLIESSRRYEPLEPLIVAELCRLLKVGVEIGIATGRGDSCASALRDSLPRELWSQVVVGYYNGAHILPLDVVDLPTLPQNPHIGEAIDRIRRDVVQGNRGRCRQYPTQCSVSLLDGRTVSEGWLHVSAILRDLVDAGDLRVWMSSHSIDVVAGRTSKRDVVSYVASKANCLPDEVLCIGDRGRWPGNDADLLDGPLTLSADECSPRQDSCWNLAGAGIRQVAATCHQLRMFDVYPGGRLRFKEDLNA